MSAEDDFRQQLNEFREDSACFTSSRKSDLLNAYNSGIPSLQAVLDTIYSIINNPENPLTFDMLMTVDQLIPELDSAKGKLDPEIIKRLKAAFSTTVTSSLQILMGLKIPAIAAQELRNFWKERKSVLQETCAALEGILRRPVIGYYDALYQFIGLMENEIFVSGRLMNTESNIKLALQDVDYRSVLLNTKDALDKISKAMWTLQDVHFEKTPLEGFDKAKAEAITKAKNEFAKQVHPWLERLARYIPAPTEQKTIVRS